MITDLFTVDQFAQAKQIGHEDYELVQITETVDKYIGFEMTTEKGLDIIGPLYWVRFIDSDMIVPRWHSELITTTNLSLTGDT